MKITLQIRRNGYDLLQLAQNPRVTALLLIGLTLFSANVIGQTVKVESLINARNGDIMVLKTSDSPKLVVLLTDNTDVAQVKGALKARKKEM